jgi:hypothetical protein
MPTVAINLNDEILLRLTPPGERMWRDYWSADGAWEYPGETFCRDASGRVRVPLWQAMRIFGEAMAMGGDLPVETSAELTTREG